ncbi:MAG: HAD family hydrolase, partial [Pedobacter sp.]|nr:HAD family hydrolase [Pedobacter sp.]
MKTLYQLLLASFLFIALPAHQALAEADPLPSWSDTATKSSITRFVEKTTTEGSPDFIAPSDRIAVFDNDGTLWAEKPVPFQLFFALDRVKALAPQHPEWKSKEPFRSILKGDMKGLEASGEKGVVALLAATHAGVSTEEFNAIVKDWIKTARHPKYKGPYTDYVYQPMLEVLSYLRSKGYKTFIVSGGGVEFMRAFAEETYGIPPEQV